MIPPPPPAPTHADQSRERQAQHRRQDPALPRHRSLHLRIPLVLEAHATVLRRPAQTGQVFVHGLLDPLAQPVRRRLDARAHLGVVSQREVVDGRGVRGALHGVFFQRAGAGAGAGACGGVGRGGRVVDAVLVEEVEEYPHVFEAGVHALAVEGDHGVGGVAEDDDGGGVVVGGAFDADEGEVGVVGELVL